MIIKSMSRKSSPGQLIKYALRYSLRENDTFNRKEHMTVLVKHNLRSRSVTGLIKEFVENESYRVYRRCDSVVIFHSVLSLSPHDKPFVTKPMLKDLAQKFIELRSPNCLNLAVAHFEKDHAHVHVVTSGVQINGRSARITKQRFNTIRKELELYQREKYPQLIYSRNNHLQAKEKNKERVVENIKGIRETKKHSLEKLIHGAFKGARTLDDFLATLSTHNLTPYCRNGRLQGIMADGLKYRLAKLGIDTQAIVALKEQGEKEARAKDEIKAIRERSSRNRELTLKQGKEPGKGIISPLQELDAFRSIRQRSQALGENERAREYEEITTIHTERTNEESYESIAD